MLQRKASCRRLVCVTTCSLYVYITLYTLYRCITLVYTGGHAQQVVVYAALPKLENVDR